MKFFQLYNFKKDLKMLWKIPLLVSKTFLRIIKLFYNFFCLNKKITSRSENLLDICEASEADLPCDDFGGKLKGKFTQYSPNSAAHCRDCQKLIENGDVRVGANVFSSSSRHAGFSINYWCLECMCVRPSIRRIARLYPTELEKILPGSELLSEPDIQRMCQLLRIPLPSATSLLDMNQARKRQTRSGRKFGSWAFSDDTTNNEPAPTTKRQRG
mmetsp:Transcript_53663/g.68918  ORF Transcript_53663/g.68918 Transcript_53663/m.68918 type:complete len:214 (-) Transcript_53663:103-744(-)